MLLGFDTNPKTVKGQGRGFLTGILYLAPSKISGFQVCPTASPGCIAACLYTAGRGGMTMTQNARIRKTKYYFEDRPSFMMELYKEIRLFVKRAAKRGMVPCIRLNGTSDIPWERVPVTLPEGKYYFHHDNNIMQCFPDVQFYDYTKRANRRNLPPNYHLTFSLSETNEAIAGEWLARGGNVAVVYRHEELPRHDTIGGIVRPVVNGFDTDLRFLDQTGAIVGLCAKGKARYDTTGFVR